MIPRFGPLWRRKMPQSAGDRVKALIAEMTIDTLIVTANCRNNWPETPGNEGDGHENR